MSTLNTRIEEKLYQNRYVVDAGKPHIKVKEHEVPSEALKSHITTCPANCYSETEQGKVEIVPDGCMECGTCRVVCADTDEIEWDYPRGGYGVLYKFG